MREEMLSRLMEAGKYQKKAIRALFPESMAGHMEVIENELSAMFMEYAMELASQCMRAKNKETQESDVTEETGRQTNRQKSSVRSINIES